MCQCKILRDIIDVYSSAKLDYPHNKTDSVAKRWQCALLAVMAPGFDSGDFARFSLGAASKGLLAINATIAALVITAWLSIVIYKSFVMNAIEGSI